jgi:hypothetical protein
VRASSTISESVYGTGPGNAAPFGTSGAPPHGVGLNEYQSPPPPASSGCGQVTPHDIGDHDFEARPILAAVGGRDLVFGAGKSGRGRERLRPGTEGPETPGRGIAAEPGRREAARDRSPRRAGGRKLAAHVER